MNEVTEHTIYKYGKLLLISNIEVNTFWTNLSGSNDDMACTIPMVKMEQYHSETRTDIEVKWLPSGKLDINELVLERER